MWKIENDIGVAFVCAISISNLGFRFERQSIEVVKVVGTVFFFFFACDVLFVM